MAQRRRISERMAHTDNNEIVCCVCGHKHRKTRMDGPHKQVHRRFAEKKWVLIGFFGYTLVWSCSRPNLLIAFSPFNSWICRRQETSWTSLSRLGARQRSKHLHALQAHSIHNASEKGKPTRATLFRTIHQISNTLNYHLHLQHHCRNCGAVVCGPCSSKKFLLPSQSTKPVRVCLQCYDSLSQSKNEQVMICAGIAQFQWNAYRMN